MSLLFLDLPLLRQHRQRVPCSPPIPPWEPHSRTPPLSTDIWRFSPPAKPELTAHSASSTPLYHQKEATVWEDPLLRDSPMPETSLLLPGPPLLDPHQEERLDHLPRVTYPPPDEFRPTPLRTLPSPMAPIVPPFHHLQKGGEPRRLPVPVAPGTTTSSKTPSPLPRTTNSALGKRPPQSELGQTLIVFPGLCRLTILPPVQETPHRPSSNEILDGLKRLLTILNGLDDSLNTLCSSPSWSNDTVA